MGEHTLSEMEKAIANDLSLLWDEIGSDCLYNLQATGKRPVMSRTTVIAVVSDFYVGKLGSRPHLNERIDYFHKLPRHGKVRKAILKLAFNPKYKVWGW